MSDNSRSSSPAESSKSEVESVTGREVANAGKKRVSRRASPAANILTLVDIAKSERSRW